MDIMKCSMVGCDNVFSGNINDVKTLFYPFPTNFNLCMLWVQNCGRPEYFEDFAFEGAQSFLNRRICSDHFDDNDFVNPEDKTLGILPKAIPNLNLVFNEVVIKEEHVDPEYADILSNTLISENELLQEIKLEKFENDNCDEVNSNFSFLSNDDSCNDLGALNFPAENNEIYRETEEEKELSDEFFRKYKNAVRTSNRRLTETDDERRNRLKKGALRAKIRRSQETEAQKTIRRMKNALRSAFHRRNETPEQRELRKRKDILRARRRRKAETEAEARTRRYNNAVRSAYRRNNETEEQRLERKRKGMVRDAKRRSMETPEQRETRLRKVRERARKRRKIEKIAEQVHQIEGGLSDFGQLSLPIEIEPAEDAHQLISRIQSAYRRNNETEEQRLERKTKGSVRDAKRRSMETPEQRETRLRKVRERARERRMTKRIAEQVHQIEGGLSDRGQLSPPIEIEPAEDAYRRNNETEEQRLERKTKGSVRDAKRRSMETLEQRETRLRKVRERARKRRMEKKIAEQVHQIEGGLSDCGQLSLPIEIEPAEDGAQPLTISTIGSIINHCNEMLDNADTQDANSRSEEDEGYKLTDISGSPETTITVPNLIGNPFVECSENVEEVSNTLGNKVV